MDLTLIFSSVEYLACSKCEVYQFCNLCTLWNHECTTNDLSYILYSEKAILYQDGLNSLHSKFYILLWRPKRCPCLPLLQDTQPMNELVSRSLISS